MSSERLALLWQTTWPRITEGNVSLLFVPYYKSFNNYYLHKWLSGTCPVAFVAFCKESQDSRSRFFVTKYEEKFFLTINRLVEWKNISLPFKKCRFTVTVG